MLSDNDMFETSASPPSTLPPAQLPVLDAPASQGNLRPTLPRAAKSQQLSQQSSDVSTPPVFRKPKATADKTPPPPRVARKPLTDEQKEKRSQQASIRYRKRKLAEEKKMQDNLDSDDEEGLGIVAPPRRRNTRPSSSEAMLFDYARKSDFTDEELIRFGEMLYWFDTLHRLDTDFHRLQGTKRYEMELELLMQEVLNDEVLVRFHKYCLTTKWLYKTIKGLRNTMRSSVMKAHSGQAGGELNAPEMPLLEGTWAFLYDCSKEVRKQTRSHSTSNSDFTDAEEPGTSSSTVKEKKKAIDKQIANDEAFAAQIQDEISAWQSRGNLAAGDSDEELSILSSTFNNPPTVFDNVKVEQEDAHNSQVVVSSEPPMKKRHVPGAMKKGRVPPTRDLHGNLLTATTAAKQVAFVENGGGNAHSINAPTSAAFTRSPSKFIYKKKQKATPKIVQHHPPTTDPLDIPLPPTAQQTQRPKLHTWKPAGVTTGTRLEQLDLRKKSKSSQQPLKVSQSQAQVGQKKQRRVQDEESDRMLVGSFADQFMDDPVARPLVALVDGGLNARENNFNAFIEGRRHHTGRRPHTPPSALPAPADVLERMDNLTLLAQQQHVSPHDSPMQDDAYHFCMAQAIEMRRMSLSDVRAYKRAVMQVAEQSSTVSR